MIISFPPALIGFARQKIIRSGSAWSPPNPEARIPDMISDATYPADLSSSAMVVRNGGAAKITASITWAGSGSGWSITKIYRNGAAILTVLDSTGHAPGTYSQTMASPTTFIAGDIVEMKVARVTNTFTVTNAYIDLVPS